MTEPVEYLEEQLQANDLSAPETAMILGSGLGGMTDEMDIALSVSYDDVPGLAGSTVEGHAGRFVVGTVGGVDVLGMDGRVHYYETGDMDPIVAPIRTLGEMGCERLLITNAAGGINADYEPGDIMLIEDHINMQGTNPLIGRAGLGDGPMFPDMTTAYSPDLLAEARDLADDSPLTIHDGGVYAATTGPSYETPAEIGMLETVGADAVGMSTVPETIVANQLGMDVVGMSTITNYAAGIVGDPLSHEEVVETIETIEDDLRAYVTALLQRFPELE
ncbi:Purine nucleoside phosphorylase protein [Halorhabdus tiamatea SARL4B]|uniref:purine-nucleoside phosphorylase n=1 Tax=Halorhabdus tiamatea SARL4B TaxID=1033806 RepID=F7PJ50_9EURY|nr:purine-nucleoside phosphorylase [Halorhabdus tiamatea]ERJ06846.1 Purine nucleoside phosphorylase protein [Halorhabdus tiamatea SARL4B]CCQ33016.1 purine nucleoside phosphorylase [Halorhabdus tiamatea SARL4B]